MSRLKPTTGDSPRYCGVCGGKLAEMRPDSCVNGTPHIPEPQMDLPRSPREERRATMSETTTVRLGFTGTRHGMTRYQRDKLRRLLADLNPAEFHHGDCIGADAQAHELVREVLPACTIMIHPPDDPELRAWCKGDGYYDPAPYLVRNQRIVDVTDELRAAPFEAKMQRRGGTWSTVRYAKRRDKHCLVITPAGNVEMP